MDGWTGAWASERADQPHWFGNVCIRRVLLSGLEPAGGKSSPPGFEVFTFSCRQCEAFKIFWVENLNTILKWHSNKMNRGGQSEDKRSVKKCCNIPGIMWWGKDSSHCLFIGLAWDRWWGESLKYISKIILKISDIFLEREHNNCFRINKLAVVSSMYWQDKIWKKR